MSTPAAKRPELTADELHHLKWILGGLLTLLSLGAVLYMEVQAWTLMSVTACVCVGTMLWPALPGRVPGVVHLLAVPFIVAFFAADVWLKTELLPAMVRLDILLLLYRNLGYRQRRDDLQVVVLGLFLVIVAGVLTVSLAFATQILVFTAGALALLLVITLTDGAEGGAARTPIPPGEQPSWVRHANLWRLCRRLRRVLDWRVAALGGALFAGVIVLSALLFLAIPRFQIENNMMLDRFISKKAKSGFTDTIRFGDVTEIQQDNSVALSVDVSDESLVPATPYWRMVVLDKYEGGTFRTSGGLRAQEYDWFQTDTNVPGAAPASGQTSAYWTFYLESGVSQHLPLLGRFHTLTFRDVQTFRAAPGLGLVSLRDDPVTMTAYRVESFELGPARPDKAFAARWRSQARRREEAQVSLALNEADRAALNGAVAEFGGGAESAAPEFVRRANAWLKQHHAYSLNPVIPAGAGDPLVRWLRSREGGHCELFAGSLVLLARTAGFPARVITGFRGGTWNGFSNNFTIRNADAHAWAEIFDEAAGAWLRADPLVVEAAGPGGEVRGEAAVVSRLDRSWTARFDSLRVFWYRRIVSFDQSSQAETVLAVKEAAQNSGRRLREIAQDAVASVKKWIGGPWDLRRITGALAALAVVAALGWGWREFGRAWWRRARAARDARHGDPVRGEAARWLARLAREERRTPETAQSRAELQRLRFGARATWPEPEKAFRRARRAIRAVRRPARFTRS